MPESVVWTSLLDSLVGEAFCMLPAGRRKPGTEIYCHLLPGLVGVHIKATS